MILAASESPGEPPQAGFSYSPTDPQVNELVEFTDQSNDPDGNVVEWHWEFGDGTTCPPGCGIGDEQNPTHRFPEAKTYTVTLTATDNEGLTDSVSKEITVTPPTVTPSGRWSTTLTMSPQTTGVEASLFDFTLASKFSMQLSLDDFTLEGHGTFGLTGFTKFLFSMKTSLNGVKLTSATLFKPATRFEKQTLIFKTGLIPGINLSKSLIIQDLSTTQTPQIETGMVISISGKTTEGIVLKSSLGIGATTGGKVVAGLGFKEGVLTLKNILLARVHLTSKTEFDTTGFKQETITAKYKWPVMGLFNLNFNTTTTIDNFPSFSLSSVKLGTTLPLDGASFSINRTDGIQSYDIDNDGQEEKVLDLKSMVLALSYKGNNVLKASSKFTFGPEFDDTDGDGADEKVTHSKLKKKEFKLALKIDGTKFISTVVYQPDLSSLVFELQSSFDALSWKGKAEFTPTGLKEASLTGGVKF